LKWAERPSRIVRITRQSRHAKEKYGPQQLEVGADDLVGYLQVACQLLEIEELRRAGRKQAQQSGHLGKLLRRGDVAEVPLDAGGGN
jgi:hypothetical protein